MTEAILVNSNLCLGSNSRNCESIVIVTNVLNTVFVAVNRVLFFDRQVVEVVFLIVLEHIINRIVSTSEVVPFKIDAIAIYNCI